MRTIAMAGLVAAQAATAAAEVSRDDFTIEGEPGITLGMREVRDTSAMARGAPVLLIHGARVPGIPSFDLPVEGGSLAADLAAAGLRTFVIDLRGYGTSTRLPAMNEPPAPTEPLVRSGAAVRDIAAAVEAIRERTGADKVALLGWATGGHWAGHYASIHPDRVSRIVFYNTLYGYISGHPAIGAGSNLEDPDTPGQFNIDEYNNYRLNTAASLLPSWDRSIPVENKAEWRDPAVAEAYVAEAMASDPTAGDRNPPSFRAPSGAMADSFRLATGAALWDARLIEADALIVRSGNDFWSRPEDVERLQAHLEARRQGRVEVLRIPEATHYVHLDRPEHGRKAFLDRVTKFLTGPQS